MGIALLSLLFSPCGNEMIDFCDGVVLRGEPERESWRMPSSLSVARFYFFEASYVESSCWWIGMLILWG